jgi:NAD(P)-dependent dehydrogenase (short-subunit alcohol dehydrogenase family)
LSVTKFAWPHFVQAGYGRIVNTASEAMLGAQPELTSYGAAKGAVWAFTRNLAAEGAELGIHANAVAPRARTRMSEEGRDPAEVDGTILARMDPGLVAPVAAYLAHESCTLNGEVLVAGGGDVFRVTPIVTLGISQETLTVEDVADHIDTIMSTEDARVSPVGAYVR